MELDEIRIAFGPYILGFVLAIIAFCGEYYFKFIISLRYKLIMIKRHLIGNSYKLFKLNQTLNL